ncbi:MAG: hypothetical protein ABJH45_19050 [Paracoccaceae bacterium]
MKARSFSSCWLGYFEAGVKRACVRDTMIDQFLEAEFRFIAEIPQNGLTAVLRRDLREDQQHRLSTFGSAFDAKIQVTQHGSKRQALLTQP